MSQKLQGFVLAAFLTTGLITGGGAMAKDKPPVATGEFQFLLVGKRIGEERFRVFKDKKDYRIEATATFIGRSRALNITSGSWTVLFSWTSWITTEERAARWSPSS